MRAKTVSPFLASHQVERLQPSRRTIEFIAKERIMAHTPYTAVVTSTGDGRNGGRATSTDGILDVTLGVPKEVGGSGDGVNPEQLFAAAWASCFHSAVKHHASERQIEVKNSAVIAEITLNNADPGGFSLSAKIHLELAGVTAAVAQEIAEAAHETCPYSKATRGNIDVQITSGTD